jgi:hypothetical protein
VLVNVIHVVDLNVFGGGLVLWYAISIHPKVSITEASGNRDGVLYNEGKIPR